MTYHKGTLEEFTTWHDAILTTAGIPEDGKIGFVNGHLAPDNQRTMAYSSPAPHPTDIDSYVWECGIYCGELSYTLGEVVAMGWFLEEEE